VLPGLFGVEGVDGEKRGGQNQGDVIAVDLDVEFVRAVQPRSALAGVPLLCVHPRERGGRPPCDPCLPGHHRCGTALFVLLHGDVAVSEIERSCPLHGEVGQDRAESSEFVFLGRGEKPACFDRERDGIRDSSGGTVLGHLAGEADEPVSQAEVFGCGVGRHVETATKSMRGRARRHIAQVIDLDEPGRILHEAFGGKSLEGFEEDLRLRQCELVPVLFYHPRRVAPALDRQPGAKQRDEGGAGIGSDVRPFYQGHAVPVMS
jgi:hypothetical protein